MGPGGYSFTRDRKPGAPLMLRFCVITVFYVPLVWHFWSSFESFRQAP